MSLFQRCPQYNKKISIPVFFVVHTLLCFLFNVVGNNYVTQNEAFLTHEQHVSSNLLLGALESKYTGEGVAETYFQQHVAQMLSSVYVCKSSLV